MSEYKGRRFDLSKGGTFVSNPPEEWGIGLCSKCKCIFETKEWEKSEIQCDKCKEISK